MTSEDSEDVKPAKRQSLGAAKSKAKKPSYQGSSDEEEEEAEYKPQKATPASKAGSKGKRGATVSPPWSLCTSATPFNTSAHGDRR
jgi:hypothetical protein